MARFLFLFFCGAYFIGSSVWVVYYRLFSAHIKGTLVLNYQV